MSHVVHSVLILNIHHNNLVAFLIVYVAVLPKLLFAPSCCQVIWVVTAVAVLLIDVDLGLYVGIAFALLTIVFRAQRYVPNTVTLQS